MTDDFLSDKHFLITLREIENGCEEFSLKELDSMDEKTINTYSNLGSVQSLLYRYVCGLWIYNPKYNKHIYKAEIEQFLNYYKY